MPDVIIAHTRQRWPTPVPVPEASAFTSLSGPLLEFHRIEQPPPSAPGAQLRDLDGLWYRSHGPEAGPEPDRDLARWARVTLPDRFGTEPGMAGVDGPVWYRRRFRLRTVEKADLVIAGAEDEMEVWIDGERSASHTGITPCVVALEGLAPGMHSLAIGITRRPGPLPSGGLTDRVVIRPTGSIRLDSLLVRAANSRKAHVALGLTNRTDAAVDARFNLTLVQPDRTRRAYGLAATVAPGPGRLECEVQYLTPTRPGGYRAELTAVVGGGISMRRGRDFHMEGPLPATAWLEVESLPSLDAFDAATLLGVRGFHLRHRQRRAVVYEHGDENGFSFVQDLPEEEAEAGACRLALWSHASVVAWRGGPPDVTGDDRPTHPPEWPPRVISFTSLPEAPAWDDGEWPPTRSWEREAPGWDEALRWIGPFSRYPDVKTCAVGLATRARLELERVPTVARAREEEPYWRRLADPPDLAGPGIGRLIPETPTAAVPALTAFDARVVVPCLYDPLVDGDTSADRGALVAPGEARTLHLVAVNAEDKPWEDEITWRLEELAECETFRTAAGELAISGRGRVLRTHQLGHVQVAVPGQSKHTYAIDVTMPEGAHRVARLRCEWLGASSEPRATGFVMLTVPPDFEVPEGHHRISVTSMDGRRWAKPAPPPAESPEGFITGAGSPAPTAASPDAEGDDAPPATEAGAAAGADPAAPTGSQPQGEPDDA